MYVNLAKIAFAGPAKQVVWALASGRYPAEEYFDDLPKQARARAEVLFRRMAEVGYIRNDQHFRNEGHDIYCFKPLGHRFACFFDERNVVVTHGFKKQHSKMPTNELNRAQTIRHAYLDFKARK